MGGMERDPRQLTRRRAGRASGSPAGALDVPQLATLGGVDARVPLLSPAGRGLLALTGFVLVLICSLVSVPAATGASPCATKVVDDWYDNGRIDNRYALPCYDEAIDAISPDIRDYIDAEEVIARALQRAARERGIAKKPHSRPRTPSVIQSPPPKDVPSVDTSAATAIPIPLLVLAALSVVLLASGASGYVIRRRREARIDRSDVS